MASGMVWILCMKNRKNKGDDSHVNQLALLIHMAQSELDHEAPAAAIFVLFCVGSFWETIRIGFTLLCQCYFKTHINTGISEFKHSCYIKRTVSINVSYFLVTLLDWYHHIYRILGKWKNTTHTYTHKRIMWEEWSMWKNICTYLAEAVSALLCSIKLWKDNT